MTETYYIKSNYVHRLNNKFFDDTGFKDEWQREVYTFANQIAIENTFQRVLDIGTGSGYKLINNFDEFDTLGIDLPKTVAWLQQQYPLKNWSDTFEPVAGYDLVIASDVIEHIPDPDTLLNLVESCSPKMIVLSTPDRSLFEAGHDGPPVNRAHVREWTMPEFYQYISSRFTVLDHFISNKKQATQVILAKLKS